MVYANGRIPATALVRAANGTPAQLLEPQTAKQWAAMVAYAASMRVHLQPEPDDGVPSCYRDFAAQEHAKEVEREGGPTAATPGYSNHGLGTAVDVLITAMTFAWLVKYARLFGFDNVEGKSVNENWHWVATRVVNSFPKPAADPATTTSEEDDDMRMFIYKDTHSAYFELLAGGKVRQVKSVEWRAIRASFAAAKQAVPLGKVSAADYHTLTGK